MLILQSKNDPPIPFYQILAGFLAAAILCFRPHIDRWAARYLLVKGRKRKGENLEAYEKMKQIEKQNEEGRAIWVAFVVLVLVTDTSYIFQSMHNVIFYPLALTFPLALITCAVSYNRFGWTNQVVQQVWLAVRFMIASSMASSTTPLETNQLFLFIAGHFMWNEVSLRTFSMFLFNHLITNLTVNIFDPEQSLRCVFMSVITIGLFCFRRRRASASAGALEPQLLTQCTAMIKLVLESGEELCSDNRDTLENVLTLLLGGSAEFTACHLQPDTISEQLGSRSSLSGIGCGTGDVGNCLLGQGMEASWTVDELMSDPDLDYLASQLLTEHHQLDNPGPRTSSPLSEVNSILAGCTEYPLNKDSHSCGSHKRQRSLSGSGVVSKLHTDELVQLSFDSLAQIDLTDKSVMWANQSFQELTSAVGESDQARGLTELLDHFLLGSATTQGPVGVEERRRSFKVGSQRLEVRSAMCKAGPAGEEVLVWALHAVGSPGESGSAPGSPGAKPLLPLEFPRASEHADPQVKVLRAMSKGKWLTGMLWVMYGKKSMLPTGTQPAIDRLYYKCTAQKSCRARLKVDMVQGTGERVSVVASGTHDHCVQLTTD
eukprot:TRINITY_DN2525_c0_g1_i6.p1 TRINITY_DN2525_c0_g1~~TRINITY_DN2525_c0_g1_i6.p1  ORF type:complete len:602 (-),score=127.35 TRINITY_DN2525_c0_g1_i6:443-2248(-)